MNRATRDMLMPCNCKDQASYTAVPAPRFGETGRCASSARSIPAASAGVVARIIGAVASGASATARAAALACGLFFAPVVPEALETIGNALVPFVRPDVGGLAFISSAQAEPAALTQAQSQAQPWPLHGVEADQWGTPGRLPQNRDQLDRACFGVRAGTTL